MKCPVCSVDLTMSERQGVEIDYCPQCRGVWLDRGELDKIIERSEAATTPTRPAIDVRKSHDDHKDKHYQSHDDYSYKKHKKKSFLGELFD